MSTQTQESRIARLEAKFDLLHETSQDTNQKVSQLLIDVASVKTALELKKESRHFRRQIEVAIIGAGTSGLVSLLLFLVMH